MKIVLDQGTPAPLRKHLEAHTVATAFELGWGKLKNGDLLILAEAAGYEVLITTDQNLRYQQNLRDRKIAVLVLSTTSWPRIEKSMAVVINAVSAVKPGTYTEVSISG